MVEVLLLCLEEAQQMGRVNIRGPFLLFRQWRWERTHFSRLLSLDFVLVCFTLFIDRSSTPLVVRYGIIHFLEILPWILLDTWVVNIT